ncbi:hypothetical protein DFQ26_007270 [Actinomortierella ambigua]|nr:hypothetical protein DFQ26_007270 [Actinomortierella ambigua]
MVTVHTQSQYKDLHWRNGPLHRAVGFPGAQASGISSTVAASGDSDHPVYDNLIPLRQDPKRQSEYKRPTQQEVLSTLNKNRLYLQRPTTKNPQHEVKLPVLNSYFLTLRRFWSTHRLHCLTLQQSDSLRHQQITSMMAQFGSAMKRLRTTFKKILPEGSSRSSSISERRPPAEVSSADKSYTRHLTGAAGTGKSVLLRHLVQHALQHGYEPFRLAPTSVAANNIGGQTIHRWFEITTAFGSTSVPLPNPVTVKMKLDAVREAGLSPVFFIDEVGVDKRNRHFHTSANVYKARIVRPPQYGSSEHSLSSIPGSATQKHIVRPQKTKEQTQDVTPSILPPSDRIFFLNRRSMTTSRCSK